MLHGEVKQQLADHLFKQLTWPDGKDVQIDAPASKLVGTITDDVMDFLIMLFGGES